MDGWTLKKLIDKIIKKMRKKNKLLPFHNLRRRILLFLNGEQEFPPKSFSFSVFLSQINKGFGYLCFDQFVQSLKKKLTRGEILETKFKVWKAYAFGEKSNHCKKILAKFASVKKQQRCLQSTSFLAPNLNWYWSNSFLFLLRHQKWEYFCAIFFLFIWWRGDLIWF